MVLRPEPAGSRLTRGEWAATYYETERVPRFGAEALYPVLAGRPGAVYLELAQDMLTAEVPFPALTWRAFPASVPHSTAPAAEVERLVHLLCRAEKSLIVAGGGVFYPGGGEAIMGFSELPRVPVTHHKLRPSRLLCAAAWSSGLPRSQSDGSRGQSRILKG